MGKKYEQEIVWKEIVWKEIAENYVESLTIIFSFNLCSSSAVV